MVVSRRQQHDQQVEEKVETRRETRSRPNFQYQARTAEQISDRATQTGGNYDVLYQNYPSYKAKVGSVLLRILPPTWDNAEHYGYDIYVHNNIGPDNQRYLCLKSMGKGKCPICEFRATLGNSTQDQKDAQELKENHRVVMWVIDRDNEAEGPKIWEMSWSMDKDFAALCQDERTGAILLIDHPDEGYDISFKREGTTMTNTKYVGKSIARRASPINDNPDIQEKWLDFITEHPIPSVLIYYSYEHIEAIFSGRTVEEKEEQQKSNTTTEAGRKSLRDELDDEIPENRPKSTTRRTVVEEETADEEDETKPPFETDKPTTSSTRRTTQKETTEEEEEQETKPMSIAERTRERLRQRQQQVGR